MELKKQIVEASDLPREAVEVPEWGVTVHIAAMGGHDRDKWYETAFDPDGKPVQDYWRSRLLVYCITDDTGKRVFDATPEDMHSLDNKNPKVVLRLFKIAKRLNGLGDDEAESAEKK